MSDWFNRNLNSYTMDDTRRSGNQCGVGRALIENFSHARSGASPLSIVGGVDIQGAKDWMVSLQKGGNHFCGGMLVAPNWVMSASHCTTSLFNLNDITANIGGVNLNNNKEFETFKIKQKHEHPSFDLVLLELEGSSKLSKPIAVNDNPNLPAGMDTTAIGWGKLGETKGVPNILQTVQLPLVSDEDCQKAYPFTFKSNKEICAGYKSGGKDACQGDSGGPLYVTRGGQDILLGATSWGEGCARAGKYGVWTKLANAKDWIKEIAPNVTFMNAANGATVAQTTTAENAGEAPTDNATDETYEPPVINPFQSIMNIVQEHYLTIIVIVLILIIIFKYTNQGKKLKKMF